jgi:hypothetical protein
MLSDYKKEEGEEPKEEFLPLRTKTVNHVSILALGFDLI